MGDQLEDITGIVQHAFGFYSILPLTALKISSPAPTTPTPKTSLRSNGTCRAITVGSYNVENLSPTSSHLSKVAAHIVDVLGSPDLIFLQEVQDDSGATDNDGIVSSNATLAALISAIASHSTTSINATAYAFAAVDPVANQDGGQPGGNIRQAYLYNPSVLDLYHPRPGSSLDATEVVGSTLPNGQPGPPELTFNPGRIDPSNPAWQASRKPVVAAWHPLKGKKNKPFYTVNVHWSSKGGGTSLHGDVRPPVNGAVEKRVEQARVTGGFIKEILKIDPEARVIAAGDFNEFAFVEPMRVFESASGGMVDLDEASGVEGTERYT